MATTYHLMESALRTQEQLEIDIVMFLGIIGTRFKDAIMRDVHIQSETVAEESTYSVLRGKQYNRAIRAHKLH